MKRGSNASCENCSQKFKVFARKKVCLTCQMAVCKSCFPQHVQSHRIASNNCFNSSPRMRKMASASVLQSTSRLFSANGPHQSLHRNTINNASFLGDALEQEDVYFLSPDHARGSTRHFDFDLSEPSSGLDDLEGVEMVETDEDDDEDDDHNDHVDDDEEDDDEGEGEEGDEEEEGEDAIDRADEFLQVHAYSKGFASVHEQRRQHREFLFLQDIVAKWAHSEKLLSSQYDQCKRSSCLTLAPIGRGIKATRRMHLEVLNSIVYAVTVTLSVWLCSLASLWLYHRLATTLLSPSFKF